MADLLFILITVAFFAVCVAFVQLCDRIIGPDSEHGELTESGEPDTVPDAPPTAEPEPPAATPVGATR